MVDLTQNPLKNAESLLQQSQQNRKRQERGDTKNLLFNLAGQVIGGVLQGRQQEKYNTFMNKKDVLNERSVVRSAVDRSQRVAERGKAAASYEGGKEAYFRDELFQLYKAKLDTELGKDGEYYDQTNVDKLADQAASKTLAQYIQNFDQQLAASQNVLSTTGGDRLAYAKALRDSSGVDLGVMGRGMRQLTSYFLNEEDRNTNNAVYRSTTSSEIYQSSKQFQETFDKFYTATGNSLVATNVAEIVKSNAGKIAKQQMTYEPYEQKYIDQFGESKTITVAKELNSSGVWTGVFVDVDTKNSISPETFNSTTTQSLKEDVAGRVMAMARQSVPELEEELDDFTRSYMSDDSDFDSNTSLVNAAVGMAGTALYSSSQRIDTVFADTDISNSRSMAIAVRTRLLDMEAHNDRPTLLNPSNENAFLTYHATLEEYGGIDDVPQGIRDAIEQNVSSYVNEVLPAQSAGRLEEVMRYVEENNKVFSNLNQQDYSLLDALDFQLRDKMGVSQEFRRASPKEASILGIFKD